MQANIKQIVKLLAIGSALVSGGAFAQALVAVWVHAGPGPEHDAYVASVKAFNDSQKDIKVDLVALPEGSYSDQVNAAALSKKLPCILDFDGPNVYNYAWTKKIIPLDAFLNSLPSRPICCPLWYARVLTTTSSSVSASLIPASPSGATRSC